MPRKAAVDDSIYLDEAEGFLLEHALFSPTRSWRPLPAEVSQSERLTAVKRKMDWDGEVKAHPDEPIEVPHPAKQEGEEDANSERCVICLMALRDRTIVGVCGHEFCFECIGVWANQSRRCPLCSTDMSAFLLHDLDNKTPTKFYLPPLPQKKVPSISGHAGPSRRPPLPEERARMQEEKQEMDELDLQVERRREIYEHELYVKHMATNPTTKFRPNPTPRQIADSPELIQRATAFLRRELRVWSLVDVEFLTTHILSLLKAIDIRSEPAIRLLTELLDTPNGPRYPHAAEHFAHEIYSFLRSPFKELWKYDEAIQYDPIPTPRSRSPSRSRSLSRSVSQSSYSRSPSPRSFPSRSRSPRSPRDPFRRDTFIPPPPKSAKKWNEHDTWIDPDHAAWLEEEKRRAEERIARRQERRRRSTMSHADRGRSLRAWSEEAEPPKVELLPSPPPPPLRMDEDTPTAPALTIRGAAAAPRKTLLERLAAAKAEAAVKSNGEGTMNGVNGTPPSEPVPPPLPHSECDPSISTSPSGVRAAVQARLRLRLKLASEKKAYVYNQNESRAQALRAKILEAKARREATETDNVLRHMDRLDRAREIRRRLMVEKMMAAETEAERKARELKEKLMGEKKAKMLREMLKERKKSHEVGVPVIAVR